MHEIRHLSCFLYRVIKITVFASATSIHLHKKVQTQVTLQLAVCASWRRFRSTETHETTSVITESMHSRCLFSDPHKTQTHCVGRT